MKKLYCIIWSKYKKIKKPKISYILEETVVFSIICCKCNIEDEKLFKEEESIKVLKVICLIENI